MENIRPIRDRILVKRIPPQERKGSLIVADSLDDIEKSNIGIVLAVSSDDQTATGEKIAHPVSTGDRVFFNRHAGESLNDRILILRGYEILGVF